jgi:hypothetical protein
LRKAKYVVFILSAMVIYSLLVYSSNASASTQASFPSQGNISPLATPTATPTPTANPTPTPSPSPTGNNLAPINDGQWYSDDPTGLNWINCPTGNIYYDSSTTHNGAPTWREEGNGAYFGADHNPISVQPGDHVTMSCWIKTSSGITPQANQGARIGIDVYWANGRITGLASPEEAAAGYSYPNGYINEDAYFVHWGQNWTQITWSFTVASQYEGDGGFGASNNQITTGNWATPAFMIPWTQIYGQDGSQNTCTSWFSDFQFYVTSS